MFQLINSSNKKLAAVLCVFILSLTSCDNLIYSELFKEKPMVSGSPGPHREVLQQEIPTASATRRGSIIHTISRLTG